MARFFGPDGIALRSRGPEADRQAVLDQIARRKEQARIVQYLCDRGEETRGKTERELRNMYDGYLLRDRLRAGKDPPETGGRGAAGLPALPRGPARARRATLADRVCRLARSVCL